MKKLSILLVVMVLLVSVAPVTSAEQWIPVGMSGELMNDRGFVGGNGCQYTEMVAISKSNPRFALMGTDVGGIFRSYDEGETWSGCNVGIDAKGVSSICIDPMNENHILIYACNAVANDLSGIYISTDGADSWKRVFPLTSKCQTDQRDCFVFDPTSYNEATGMCMRAYWSTPNNKQTTVADSPKALYVTEDGGFTWNPLANSEQLWDADLAMSDKGELFVGGQGGFFVSRDQGKSFEKILDDWTLSVDYVSARPNNVYVSTWDKVLISTDSGKSFNIIEGSETLPKYSGKPAERTHFENHFGFRHFNVSPVNPEHMVISPGLGSYNWMRYMSQDGGKTWYQGEVDYFENQVHYSTRTAHTEWSYLDENTVFSSGGDWITKSTNGGLTYRWASNGYQGFMGYGISVNYHNPDLMLIYGQDYGGFGSYDGGESWTYAVLSPANRGGCAHGGLIVSEDFAFAISAKDEKNAFSTRPSNVERELKIARGYHNLDFKPSGLNPETYFCYQSQNNEDILFAGVLRSTDRGETWEKMEGCNGVLCHNTDPNGQKELYGINETSVVVSYDEGATWKEITSLNYKPDSMAYNWKRGYLFVAKYAGNSLDRIDVKTGNVVTISGAITAASQRRDVWSVDVDPVDPDLMYIAGAGNYFLNRVSVQRSHDAGETWEVIARQEPELTVIKEGEEGPAEANTVLVNPKTRELWVTTSCFGTYKLSATNPGEPAGYYPEEKLFATEKDEGTYLRWYGNGRYDLSNVAFESSISDIFKEHDGWYENLYEGFFGRNIPNDAGTMITELDIDTAAWHAFNDWENPIYTYDVMRSDDGKEWQKLITTNATEFTDKTVESGKTYYYKVVRTIDGKNTVTRTVTAK